MTIILADSEESTSSYSGDPTDSDKDWIRDRIGDVDEDAFLLTDAEIVAEISNSSNLYIAASECAYKCVTRLGEYDKLAVLFQSRGDKLKEEAKRKRFTTNATLTQVKDVATYPERFVHGDEHLVEWDIDG
jgi:hypothetical protein